VIPPSRTRGLRKIAFGHIRFTDGRVCRGPYGIAGLAPWTLSWRMAAIITLQDQPWGSYVLPDSGLGRSGNPLG